MQVLIETYLVIIFLFDQIVALAINVKFYNGRKAAQDITEMQVENKIL
jgi:hypothetical protein